MVLRSPRTRSCVALEEEEERSFGELWLGEWRLWRSSTFLGVARKVRIVTGFRFCNHVIFVVFSFAFLFFSAVPKHMNSLFALCPHYLRKHCCNDTPFRSFAPAPFIFPSYFFAHLKHFIVLRHGSTPLPFRGLHSVGHQCIGLCTQHNQASDGMWTGQWRH